MTSDRFRQISQSYSSLTIGVVGDYCLDRYLEIDPSRAETSIETGLPVYNIERVRPQPGAAGTILNNLVALGVGTIVPVGFRGDDGEGYELERALQTLPGVELDFFITSRQRKTFTYTKPLLVQAGCAPRELNRLDTKNWTPTPDSVSEQIALFTNEVLHKCDAVIVLDQVDTPDTGVVTPHVLAALRRHGANRLVIADSRRGLADFPPCLFKMNATELARLCNSTKPLALDSIPTEAAALARRNGKPAVVTMAEHGLLGALPSGAIYSTPALPLRGEIDIVGAGDSVTANLATALAAGATLGEALHMAALASSVVIHQLGTSGAASPAQMLQLLE